MLLRPGDLLEGAQDTYTIAATLSRGAYGCAHTARTSDGAWRVIKQFEPSEELSATDWRYQQVCFQREADILTRFHHPAIVYGYELVARDDELFLVMEYVQGATLRSAFDRHRLHTGGPYALPQVLGLGAALCEAFDWLHNLPEPIIYRDLKPSNIMWDAVAQRIRLIDFGAARFNAAGGKATQGLGTAGYAPPELYGQGALSPATDVYTLGAVLYELATGETPPDRQTPVDFRGQDDRLPEAFQRVILKSLAQDPAKRYDTAAHFAAALAASDERATARDDGEPTLNLPPANFHSALACFCPVCGREPKSAQAVYCGYDGAMYQVALLQIVPRYRPVTTVYLDRNDMTIGRADPDQDWYPSIDLTASDPARHVSRRHLRITRAGAQFTATALQSTNDTRLEGRKMAVGESQPLPAGARLELGDLVAKLIVRPVLDNLPASGFAATEADCCGAAR